MTSLLLMVEDIYKAGQIKC